MGITIIEHEDLFSVALFPKKNPISQCLDTRKNLKSYLWKCKHQKACIKHLILIIFFITFIIFMCRFFKVMPSSSRTESTSKSTSIIITDPSTTKKAALFNVWSSQTQITVVWNRDRTDHQSANSTVVIIENRPTGEHDIR